MNALILANAMLFLSTLSLRRATGSVRGISSRTAISIHALLAESDSQIKNMALKLSVFLSTLSLRRATNITAQHIAKFKFLSTLSLRRATAEISPNLINGIHFYPRSPCGERPSTGRAAKATTLFLSTLSLRRATLRRSKSFPA